MVFEAVGVAAQLLLNAVSRSVESDFGFPATVGCLEHDPVHDRSDDIASKVVVWAATEGDVGSDSAREIFFRDFGDSALGVCAQRIARVDLVSSDPNLHFFKLLKRRGRRLRPPATGGQPALAKRSQSGLTN